MRVRGLHCVVMTGLVAGAVNGPSRRRGLLTAPATNQGHYHAVKTGYELGVSLYARTCYTRALNIDTFSARVRISARSYNETYRDINRRVIQCNAQGLHNVC